MGSAVAIVAAITVLAAVVGSETDRAGLLRAAGGAAGHTAGRLTRRRAFERSSWRPARSYFLRERTAHRKAMPASKHRRRGKTRPRWVTPPCPPRHRITEEDRR